MTPEARARNGARIRSSRQLGLFRSLKWCCGPRLYGAAERLARTYDRPCSAIVAASLVPDPDGTWPSMAELEARLAAAPPAARRVVYLPVWQ